MHTKNSVYLICKFRFLKEKYEWHYYQSMVITKQISVSWLGLVLVMIIVTPEFDIFCVHFIICYLIYVYRSSSKF